MVHAQPRKWDEQNSLGFWDTNGSSNLGQTTKPSNSQKKKKGKKKENLSNRELWRPGWPLKESEKRDKYLYLARELINLWNMKVTVIPHVIGALGTIPKRLAKELEDLEIKG